MKLTGMNKLVNKLDKGMNIDTPVKQIVRKHSSTINRNAQKQAPVDTGELRRSIRTEYQDGGLTGVTRAGAHYAPYVEYGTRFMTAKPFMRPAFYNSAWDFKEELEKLVK
ncbi:HK97-gp10 family putative phage morphogenesis protein [Bhargavaea ginsengi]|uniref:HK97-gp10 family putative phage morphogenesis protein n=1 Tax=Bhargavaea ginsengi TaxID=426757 RepID=UPI003C78C9C1